MATYYLERWHMDPVKAQKQVVLAAEREVANREGGTKPEPPDTLSERVLATEYTGMPPGEVARALGVDVRIVLVTRYEASVTIDHGLPTASIRGLRKSHGMTQAELATRAGVSRSSIQTAERVGPSMKVRQAIASAFKVPPETLSA
jgi:DNA-binding XRE family transcriptional regulator